MSKIRAIKLLNDRTGEPLSKAEHDAIISICCRINDLCEGKTALHVYIALKLLVTDFEDDLARAGEKPIRIETFRQDVN